MMVLILERVTPALRASLSRWLLEPRAGVFVGNLPRRTRDLLWQRVAGRRRLGSCMMLVDAQTEQGFEIETSGEPTRRIVDMDGLSLVQRSREAPEPAAEALAAAAEVDVRTVARFLEGKNIRPRLRARIEAARQRLTGGPEEG